MDKTILISNDLRRYLTQNYRVDAGKFVIVRNGIETARFKGIGERGGVLREELGVPAGCKLVGFIGRFTEQKRPLLFLEVIRRVLEQRDDIRFYLVGEGPLAPKLERQIARLGIAGMVSLLPPRDDIPAVLDSTDLLVLTSLYEGAPLTVLEALASHVPVVASDVGAIREYASAGCDLVACKPHRDEAERLAGAVLERLAQRRSCSLIRLTLTWPESQQNTWRYSAPSVHQPRGDSTKADRTVPVVNAQVTIVIVNWNRKECVLNLLDSLRSMP